MFTTLLTLLSFSKNIILKLITFLNKIITAIFICKIIENKKNGEKSIKNK